MRVLGISAFYHDSAAALVEDGRILAAAQEERFTRKKHDPRFPAHAVAYCLREAKVDLAQVDRIVFYDKPFLKFERLLETYLAFAPRGFRSFRMATPIWLREKLFLKDLLTAELSRFGRDKKALQTQVLFSYSPSTICLTRRAPSSLLRSRMQSSSPWTA
jgi:carbamoyltransferase